MNSKDFVAGIGKRFNISSLHWYLAIIYNPAALLEDAGSVELSSATAQTFEDAFEDFRNLPQSCSADNMVAFEDANMTTPAYPELETAETNIEGLPDHFDSADVVMEEVLEEGSSSKPVECSPTQASNSDSVGHSQSSQESVVVSRKRSPQPIELGSSPTRTPGKRGLKKKSAIERDKEREKEAKVCQALQKCHVIILDSLGNSHSVALKNLKTYLMLEAQEKKKLHIVQKTFGIHAKVLIFSPRIVSCLSM